VQYDVIGDIHGCADALAALLRKLGYRDERGAWRHPDRQAVFVGDFIDRGPQQVETVQIARRMVDAGTALAVMGNHELNAIGWFTPNPSNPAEHLRRHTTSNRDQHRAFLQEVEGTPLHGEIIDWFKTLPLWLELPGLNVVHACWHEPFMAELATALGPNRTLPDALHGEAFLQPTDDASKDTPDFTMFKALEALTKGMEANLPPGCSFLDGSGRVRTRVRVQWWRSGAVSFLDGAEAHPSIRDQLVGIDPALQVPTHATLGYGRDVAVLFGHYWRTGTPEVIDNGRLACTDYSIANGGKLVAYRWEGEPLLVNEHFISV
jgi:hypothetical protein